MSQCFACGNLSHRRYCAACLKLQDKVTKEFMPELDQDCACGRMAYGMEMVCMQHARHPFQTRITKNNNDNHRGQQ